ncbi:TetR/AcrR family transcriptional regulator [Plantactinospora siamensis]|uniref:TetR/AcrR family transcriptional regulator n=1 Tax=Plantactinospora siamensis TaxID=555372 RepID=A0ABV6NQY0_9ACTN
MPPNVSGPQSACATPPAELLELRATPPRERADAARNRVAVLEAAAVLFRERGVDGVSMDAVAAAAGVGKGTLFRRFGDRAGLATALLDEQERGLQEAILFGPAPLGPGAAGQSPPAGDRLRAFLDAYLDYLLAHLDLVRVSETATSGARYRIGAYRFWHRHVSLLLAGRPDPAAAAHTLLAALGAEHVTAVRAEIGAERLRTATRQLADALLP